MPAPPTLRAVFDAELRPAVRVSDLNDRLRRLGSASTPRTLMREVAAGADGLRTIEAADPVLRTVVEHCPQSERPIGADAVVVDRGDGRGLRPTPADAVRVLARDLGTGDRRDRARWTRLLHGLHASERGGSPGVR
jgi:hypothetical protein